MSKTLSVPISDHVPKGDSISDYDRAHLAIYLRMLDAEKAGAAWRKVALIVLGVDPDAEPVRALRIHSAHLERARFSSANGDLWMREIERARFN
jgi:hypothetical protein